MTEFITFTSEGGRFGRIVWDNTDENYWGGYTWDTNWPVTLEEVQLSAIAKAAEQLTAIFSKWGASYAKATEVVAKFAVQASTLKPPEN